MHFIEKTREMNLEGPNLEVFADLVFDHFTESTEHLEEKNR